MCAGKHASLGIYVQGNNKLGDTLIPATPVPNRQSTLGTNFYQPLVVEICQNTCTSREKTLQLLHNHSVSHLTHSQSSSVSFLWFLVICGSIAIVGFQRSHDLDEILEIFFTFSSLELKVTKTTKPYRFKHDW